MTVIKHSIVLSIITFCTVSIYIYLINDLYNKLNREYSVHWSNPLSVDLSIGPVWFNYDMEEEQIQVSKAINETDKYSLLFLFPKDKKLEPTYIYALNELAFRSNKNKDDLFWLIMILGGLGSLIGVMIRSISSFIFHLCVIDDLDMKIWWTWYYLRPIMGFALGVAIVMLSKSELLNITSPNEISGFWILGLCILVGFAVSEVTDRLYYMAKAIFGDQSLNKKE